MASKRKTSHLPQETNKKSKLDFASKFQSSPLRVITGSAGAEYYVHKTLLSTKSPYFNTLLSSDFHGVEKAENTLCLPDVEDFVFSAFVDFLYLDEYAVKPQYTRSKACRLHVELYILAERFCMDDLKSLALTQFRIELEAASMRVEYRNTVDKRLRTVVVMELVDIIYKGTLDRCVASNEMNTNQETSQVENGDISIITADISANPERERDKMRTLIGYYCASIISTLRSNPTFIEKLRDDSEFAEDLVHCIPDGPNLAHIDDNCEST